VSITCRWLAPGKEPACSLIAWESYVASNDPDFEAKAVDVIGLYLNPPQHSIVFSVDEKTAIQAFDRRFGSTSRPHTPAG
jgi:hypothetical protein